MVREPVVLPFAFKAAKANYGCDRQSSDLLAQNLFLRMERLRIGYAHSPVQVREVIGTMDFPCPTRMWKAKVMARPGKLIKLLCAD
jgi:hypothetical protein